MDGINALYSMGLQATDTALALAGLPARPRVAPTPRDVVHAEAQARVYRFRPQDAGRGAVRGREPVLLVPSLINRWYALDLCEGASLAGSLVEQGFDTFCLDWGVTRDADRYVTWDDLVARIGRAVRVVQRTTGAARCGLLGYSISATLAAIYTSLEPARIRALVNLAGPFDFARAGLLSTLTDPRWFDADAVAAAGNVSAAQMLAGFLALRPMGFATDAVTLASLAHEGDREGFARAMATLAWAYDSVAFPAAAYATYIRELYQENRLIRGTHRVGERAVSLRAIECPVLSVVATRDAICPPASASALNEHCGARDAEVLLVPGGHISAVVGPTAPTALYAPLGRWLAARLARSSEHLTSDEPRGAGDGDERSDRAPTRAAGPADTRRTPSDT